MRLRLLWIFASVMLMFFVFSPPAFATATQCQIHKNTEWRCGKDNFGADRIRIGNESTRNASFRVSKWISTCGKKGNEIFDQTLSLNPSTAGLIDFEETRVNQCLELFVFDCEPDACTKILSVHPA
jgi:hypothetical protein